MKNLLPIFKFSNRQYLSRFFGIVKFILLLTVSCSPFTILLTATAQNQHVVDSLTTKLKKYNQEKIELRNNNATINDTIAADILYDLSFAYWGNHPDMAIKYGEQLLSLSEQIGYKKGIGNAYNAIGGSNNDKGDYVTALEFHNKALKVREDQADEKGVANSYNNIGSVYDNQGNYIMALKNHFASLKIREQLDDKDGIATSNCNIGVTYYNQGNYAEALKSQMTALKIYKKLGDIYSIALSYNNIGTIYDRQNNKSEAIMNYRAALKINEKIGEKLGAARNYNNIGGIYDYQNNESEALKNHFLALKLFEEMDNKKEISRSFCNIGYIYFKQKKYKDAGTYYNNALGLSREIGSLEQVKQSYENLALLDSAQGNFSKALEHYKLYITYRDSLVNKENTRKTVALQMNYDFDKKEAATKAEQEKKDALVNEEQIRNKQQKYLLILGLIMALSFGLWDYRQKKRISSEKKKADELNKELQLTLTNLKTTQEQLIKSEKMAAFGTVASRLSHEILNPLNFVNNFSVLSKDLVTEINTTNNAEERKEASELLTDNLEKINEHGKRAADIVKQLQEMSSKGTAGEFFEDDEHLKFVNKTE